MTLRLVSENEHPAKPSLLTMLRSFTDELGRGEWGEIERISLVLEYDGGLTTHCLGEISDIEQMGMFEAAKLMVFADAAAE